MPTTPPLDASMGAMLLGVIASAVLYGVSLVQTFYYYIGYPKDLWYLKTLVLLTVAFDTVHQAMITHMIYCYLITNFSNPESLKRLQWSLVIEALFTGLTGALVQAFYTIRVWQLSKRNILLSGGILFLVVANAGCGTVWVILAMRAESFEHLLNISALTITINALSAAIDVIIATTLCIMLNKIRTGFKRSDTIINRLILFVVNTGILTSCCAVASLISLLASPKTLIYATFYFCIGRFYSNSLLATLNARQSISSNVDEISHTLVSMPSSVTAAGSARQKSHGNISIRIDTAKHEDITTGQEAQSDDDLSMQKNFS